MLGPRFPLFRAAGVPVTADVTWPPVVGLIAWTLAGQFRTFVPGLADGVAWTAAVVGALGLFASVTVHEFGHILVARRNGVGTRRVTLFCFGGVAVLEDEPPGPGAEFRIAVGGPLVSVACFVLFFALWRAGLAADWLLGPGGAGLTRVGGVNPTLPLADWRAAAVVLAAYLTTANAMLVLFNLLPAFPLDGGRVLRSIVWARTGRFAAATRVTARLGATIGLLLAGCGVAVLTAFGWPDGGGGVSLLLVGLFLHAIARRHTAADRVRAALRGTPVGRIAGRGVRTVPAAMTLAEFFAHRLPGDPRGLYPVRDDGGGPDGDATVGLLVTRAAAAVPRSGWNDVTVADVAEPLGDANRVRAGVDLLDALGHLHDADARALLVVDDAGEPVGLFTRSDAAAALAGRLGLGADARDPAPVL